MKKTRLFFSVLVFACSVFNYCLAQNPELFGMTYGGGAYSSGTIFKLNGDGSGFQTVYSFTAATGKNPYGSLLQAADGKLYGMTSQGGANSYGVIFRFDPASYTYDDVFDFNTLNGTNPYGSLIQAGDGRLYGMTAFGGANNDGVIFSFNPVSQTYMKLFDYVDSLGAIPKGDLLQAADGRLYGMTGGGGKKFYGVLFSFDPVTHVYTRLMDFLSANGKFPYGSLTETNDGMLYGTTRSGGDSNAGVIFSFNTADSSYTSLYDFPGINIRSPSAGLLPGTDGKFYGMTLAGGAHDMGSVYSFDTLGYIYTSVLDFDSLNGSAPQFNTFMQAGNGLLYGMTDLGGSNNTGVLFSIDPANNSYAKLVDFNGANGSNPKGALIELQAPAGVLKKETRSVWVYPNPAGKELIIDNGKLIIESIGIYNALGEKVSPLIDLTPNPSPLGEGSASIDVSGLCAGVYFMKVKSAGGIVVKMFVKE